MKKRLSYTIDVLLVGIILVLGYAQISMMMNKKWNVPSAFGVSFLYVATDSMDDGDAPNSMPAGTGIIIQNVKDLSTIKKSDPIYKYNEDGTIAKDGDGNPIIQDWEKNGDVVTFYWEKISYADTHRVVDTWVDESGKRWFKTMGDNPKNHKAHQTETWEEKYLIGKVVHHSKALGTFLEISSPQIAQTITIVTKEQHTAWLFPLAIIIPVAGLAISYVGKVVYKSIKEEKEKEAKIEAALKESGIDLNDEEACELFRMKEGFRLEYREELQKEIDKAKEDARLLYEKEKKKALKEMKKASKVGLNSKKLEKKEEN